MVNEKRAQVRSVLVGLLVGLAVATTGPAVASSVAAMMLGQTNAVDASTRLSGDVTSSNLRIINTSDSGIALRLDVEPGNAPMKVNSDVKVADLNADRLDGKSSGAFLKKSVYDSNKDGVVDSAEVKVRYEDSIVQTDASAPIAARVTCATAEVTFDDTTTVLTSGGLDLQPVVASTATVFGRVYYSADGGITWAILNGVGVEATPSNGGLGKAAMPIDAVGSVPAGTYSFAIVPVGAELQSGTDYAGYCELSVLAFTGLGTSIDMVADSVGADSSDEARAND